jgi:tetratricopeptide (TPR) repeat protein
MGCWLGYRKGRGPKGWLGLSALFLLGAALSKENGLCFALALAAYAWLGQREDCWAWGAPLLAALAGLGLKWLAIGGLWPGAIGFIDNPLAYASHALRVLNGFGILVQYLKLLVFPWPLAADYSYDQIPVLKEVWSPELWLALGLVLCLTGWAIQARRRAPLALWSLLSGGAALLVSSILVPSGTLFAERLLYIPAAGFCLGVGWCLERLRGQYLALALVLWIVETGALVRQRGQDWKSDLALFAAGVQVNPRSARQHYGLGLALHQRGELEEALAAYDRALAIFPRYADAHYNRGAALLSLGRKAEAHGAYAQALHSRPGYAKALYAMALLELDSGQEQQAERKLQRLVQDNPGHVQARRSMVLLLWKQGRTQEARRLLEEGMAQGGDQPELLLLAEELSEGTPP